MRRVQDILQEKNSHAETGVLLTGFRARRT